MPICDDCKTCERFKRCAYPGFSNENIAQCFTWHSVSPITSVVVEGFTRCPWPGMRKEIRTKEQLFFIYLKSVCYFVDDKFDAQLREALRAAGYEPKTKDDHCPQS